jgi:replicative DNA helicase
VLHGIKGQITLEEQDVAKLQALIEMQVTPGQVKELGPILIDLSRKRILRRLGEYVAAKSINGENPELIIEKTMSALIGLGDKPGARGYQTIKQITADVITELDTEQGKPLSTGFLELDLKMDGGLYLSETTGLAGETSKGKSCLAGNIILNIALQGIPCCYFTLEISGKEIHRRLTAAFGGVNYHDIRQRHVKGHAGYGTAVSRLSELPIVIDDTVGATLPAMLSRIHKVMREYAPQLIVMDYIQKMSAPASRENRAHELGLITTALSLVARDYNNHVIIVSQLHRRGQNDGKYPTLARMRESGRIEEDCSNVLLLHRDEIIPGRHYNTETTLIIAKQRNGAPGIVKLGFDGQHQRFYEITELKGEK